MSLRARYCAAQPFVQFLDGVQANAELLRSLARRADVPAEIMERVHATGVPVRPRGI